VKLKRLTVFVLVGLLALGMVLTGCGQESTGPGETPGETPSESGSEDGPKSGGTLYWALARDIVAFEPQVTHGATSADHQMNIYDKLLNWDAEGNMIGELATSWEWEDDTTFVLKLREGVKFHEGGDFNAADVKFSLERILDPDTGATRRSQLTVIEDIEIVDDYTVRIHLQQPYSVLPAILTMKDVAMLDKEWVEDGHDLNKETNGTGPFMLTEAEPEVRYVLEKNPNFWQEGKPYLDKIVQTVVNDDKARMNALYGGEADFTTYVPWTELERMQNDDMYTVYLGYDSFNLLRMNPSVEPFDDVRVRQGMNFLTDRQALIDLAWGGYGQPITGGLSQQGQWWHYDELDGTYVHDVDKARELFEEAGITDPSAIEMVIRSISMTVHWDTAQVVANQLTGYGFDARIEPQEVAALIERRITGDYQLMQDGLSASYPDPDYMAIYFSTEGTSYATGVGFSVDKIDSLFEDGRTKLDLADRKPIYKDLQAAILDEAPWVYQLWRPQAEASSCDLHGYVRSPALGIESTQFAEDWWLDR